MHYSLASLHSCIEYLMVIGQQLPDNTLMNCVVVCRASKGKFLGKCDRPTTMCPFFLPSHVVCKRFVYYFYYFICWACDVINWGPSQVMHSSETVEQKPFVNNYYKHNLHLHIQIQIRMQIQRTSTTEAV